MANNILDPVVFPDDPPKPPVDPSPKPTPKPKPDNDTAGKDDAASIVTPVNNDIPPVGAVFAGDGDDETVDLGQFRAAFDAAARVLTLEQAAQKYCRDVLIPQTSQTATHDANAVPGSAHATITRTEKLWSFTKLQVVIKYHFVSGKPAQQAKVKQAIEEWTWYGNISFEEVPAGGTGAQVRIGFNPAKSAGSWSLVGRDCTQADEKEQTMNLGWIDPENDITAAERAVILHEFGHVLGMLHEHQSPAGGGVPVKLTEGAMHYYEESQGWTPDTVKSQVINVYNMKDVSSFSQVDRLSIMQYPMPRFVTGLDYDIDYNYSLSELDKAYIGVMYPRPDDKAHTKAPDWNFSFALAKTGITRESPEAAAKIMDAYRHDVNSTSAAPVTTIDPSRIRQMFASWCKDTHRAAANGNSQGGADPSDPQRGLDPNASPEDSDPPIYIVDLQSGDMCATQGAEDPTSPRAALRGVKNAAPGDAAHAVIDETWLTRNMSIPNTAKGKPLYQRNITWTIVKCPKSSSTDTDLVDITDYQTQLVQDCLAEWQRHASIQFTRQDTPEPDIVFTFQRYAYDGKTPLTLIPRTGGARSYTNPWTMERTEAENPKMRHTICLRSISETAAESKQVASARILDEDENIVNALNAEFDRRSVIHEVGHWLGLHHEEIGVYSYIIFSEPPWADEIAKRKKAYIATRFDYGSIMDCMHRPEILKQYLDDMRANGEDDIRMRVRTVFDLSAYDKANIALLHPGRKFSGPRGPDLIRAHGKKLQLKSTTIKELVRLAAKPLCDWQSFRTTYLAALEAQMAVEADEINRWVSEIRDYARDPANYHGIKPDDPSHFITPPPNNSTAGSSDGLLRVVYNALVKNIGPTGSQILSLQSPTRYLAKDEFRFNLQGVYSNFVKPTVVAEAEFRLTDALYDAAAVVSAPNGKSLSNVYHQILNNFVPRYDDADRNVRKERERIRSWLLTEVGDQDPYYKLDFNSSGGGQGDNPEILRALNSSLAKKTPFVRKMSRMEFSSQLSQDYYQAQMNWELQRDKIIRDAMLSKDPDKLDAATRQLAHISLTQQGILAMHNANAVVRGYSHVVREALGHLDVATPAEILQDAKDSFRGSAFASLYGASKVYPVLMEPVDWSEGLDTGFAPEDLAENPSMLIMMIQTKSSSLDNLKRQLTLLQSSKEGDPAALKSEVEKKARELEKLESDLHAKYLDSTVELAKIAIAIATDGASMMAESAVKDIGAIDAIKDARASKDDINAELAASVTQLDLSGSVEDIKDQIAAVSKAQKALQGATSAWNSKKVALARAEATSTKSDQVFLENQIATITSELSDLKARYTAAVQARKSKVDMALASNNKGDGQLSVGELVASKPPAIGGGSRWQEINITHDQVYKSQSSLTEGSSFSERWNCDFWIGSASGSNENQQGTYKSKNEDKEIHLEISMKVTTVTVDRSSWFRPDLFENTSRYMKNNSGLTYCKYPDGYTNDTPQTLAKSFINTPADVSGDSLLPSYPVAYIFCKDVFIKVSKMNISTSEEKQHLLEKSQASGGCLFFHYSRASEHSRDSSSATFEMASDGMIIRIPGPQILAYVQQIVPQDGSKAYDPGMALERSFYLPPMASLGLSENPEAKEGGGGSAGGDGGAMHAIKAPGESGEGDDGKGLPMFDVQRTSMTPGGSDKNKANGAVKADEKADATKKDMANGVPPAGRDAAAAKNEPAKAANAPAPVANGMPPPKENGVKINGHFEGDDDQLAFQALARLHAGDDAFKEILRKALGGK